MNRIGRILDFIETASVIYYARAVEGCAALMLIGLALYISDERVVTYGLVRPLPSVPMHIAMYVLLAVATAQFAGITMPVIHDLFKHYGFKNRWLTRVWVNEKTWRVCALVADIAILGAFSALMSTASWTRWLFVGPYCLLLTISIFRLEAKTDADRTTGDESVSRHDLREPDDTGPLLNKGTLEMVHPPKSAATSRRAGNISACVETN
jgi:hypothetical protein